MGVLHPGMVGAMADGSPSGLDSRSLEILDAVVRLHTETGRAVSSGLVERALPRSLSSASIRAVMKSLEDRGYLEKPHTSAGRLPTDAGYRVYVDRLRSGWSLSRHEPPAGMLQLARQSPAAGAGQGRIKELAKLLSLLTRNISIIVGPTLEGVSAVRIEFYPRSQRRLLMVVILENGQVQTRLVDLPEDCAGSVVSEAAGLLNERIRGRTLGDLRQGVLPDVDLISTPVSRCALAMARQSRKLFQELQEGEVELEGVAQVLDEPEFHDPEPLKALIRFLESPRTIRDSLNRLHGGTEDPFGVWIGRENPIGALRGFSLLTGRIELDGRQGLLAVLGPRRLPYQRAFFGMEILRRLARRPLGSAPS